MSAPETTKPLTQEQQQELEVAFARARKALAIIETYDQARVDRLCQAVAWAVANKQTFTRLVDMGIEESGLGDAVSARSIGDAMLAAGAYDAAQLDVNSAYPRFMLVAHGPAGKAPDSLELTDPLIPDLLERPGQLGGQPENAPQHADEHPGGCRHRHPPQVPGEPARVLRQREPQVRTALDQPQERQRGEGEHEPQNDCVADNPPERAG